MTQRSGFEGTCPTNDRWGIHHYSLDRSEARANVGSVGADVGKQFSSLWTTHPRDTTGNYSIRCWPYSGPSRVGRSLRKDLCTDRVTQGWVTMFVLGACWAWDPPRQVVGLKAQILTKFDVKTPPFVGIVCEDCKWVIGLSALIFCNVMLDLEIYQWSTNHGIL